MRKITANSELIIFFFLIAFAVFLVGGLKVSIRQNPSTSPSTTGPGKHGAFSVHTPQEVDQAAQLGISYVISYFYGHVGSGCTPATCGDNALDPTKPIGQALERNHMKATIEITDLYSCPNGQNGSVALDTNEVTRRVQVNYQRPLLLGYWIKDDNSKCAGMADKVIQAYNIIRSIDKNPNHIIIAGFGDVASTQNIYQPGMADVVGLYPYEAYSSYGGPKGELPLMLQAIHAKDKAAGKPPTPFIGIYQAFYPFNAIGPTVTTDQLISDVQTYMQNGALSVAGFGWEASDVVGAGTSTALQQQISAVNQWLNKQ